METRFHEWVDNKVDVIARLKGHIVHKDTWYCAGCGIRVKRLQGLTIKSQWFYRWNKKEPWLQVYGYDHVPVCLGSKESK